MDCYYLNPHTRQLEGTFKLRLPHAASPYYLAFGQAVLLDKNNNNIPFNNHKKGAMALTPEAIRYSKASSWNNVKEARIVPREKAAYAFTESTHRRVDPALLEWAGADIFNCRVLEHLSRSTGGALFTIASEDQVARASRAFRTLSWRIEEITLTGCSDPLVKGRPVQVYNGQTLAIAGRGELPDRPELVVTLSQNANRQTVTGEGQTRK